MSDDPVDRVLELLCSAKRSGSGWIARCPAHEDDHESLSMTRGDDGRALLHCHAGCAIDAIVAALGLTLGDLFPPSVAVPSTATEITYDYCDEAGALLFQVVRSNGKRFRQRRPDGNGGWVWNMDGVRRVLYRLPELAGHKTVTIAEGEKDCDTLRRHGFTATSNPHGAGKWRDDYTAQLKAVGCTNVVIFPDNDAPGATHARTIARSCHAAGLAAKIVPLPGLPKKGDVSDFLRTHTREDLLQAIGATVLFDPRQLVTAPLALELTDLSQLLDEPEEQFAFLLEDRIPVGGVVMLAAPPKAGKSTTARAMTFAIATGRPFLGWSTRQGAVWYLALEEKRSEVRKAFRRLGATGPEPIRLFLQQAPADLLAQLHARAREERPALIVVDTLQRLIKTKDLNDYALVTAAFEPLLALSRETGAALLLIHHASTHAAREGLNAVLGSTGLSASVDNVLVLARSGQRRVLSSVQRIGPDLDPVVLALDATTSELTIAGRQADIERLEAQQAILDALHDQTDGVTESWIRQNVECRIEAQWRALRDLYRQGQVSRSGQGKRGSPYRYSRVVSCSEGVETGNKKREQEISGAAKGDRLDFGDSCSACSLYRNTGNTNPDLDLTPSPVTSTDHVSRTSEPELSAPREDGDVRRRY